MRIRPSLLIGLALLSQTISAGELECMIGCSLDGLASGFTWKPSRCYKPSPPMMLYVSNAREYNNAVDEFNRWVSQVDSYLSCIRNEALGDIKAVPDLIIESAKKLQQEMSSEVQRQRTNLQLTRP